MTFTGKGTLRASLLSIAASLPLLIEGCAANAPPPSDELPHRADAVIVDFYSGATRSAACSGTLLAQNVVLTAAHCADNSTAARVTAPNSGGQEAAVSRVFVYDWASSDAAMNHAARNDLAILVLRTPIKLSSYARIRSSGCRGCTVVQSGRTWDENGVHGDAHLRIATHIAPHYPAGHPMDVFSSQSLSDSGGGVFHLVKGSPGNLVGITVGRGRTTRGGYIARLDNPAVQSWIRSVVKVASRTGSSTTAPTHPLDDDYSDPGDTGLDDTSGDSYSDPIDSGDTSSPDDTSTDNTSTDDTSTDNTSTDDTSTDDTSTGDTATGDNSGDTPIDDTTSGDETTDGAGGAPDDGSNGSAGDATGGSTGDDTATTSGDATGGGAGADSDPNADAPKTPENVDETGKNPENDPPSDGTGGAAGASGDTGGAAGAAGDTGGTGGDTGGTGGDTGGTGGDTGGTGGDTGGTGGDTGGTGGAAGSGGTGSTGGSSGTGGTGGGSGGSKSGGSGGSKSGGSGGSKSGGSGGSKSGGSGGGSGGTKSAPKPPQNPTPPKQTPPPPPPPQYTAPKIVYAPNGAVGKWVSVNAYVASVTGDTSFDTIPSYASLVASQGVGVFAAHGAPDQLQAPDDPSVPIALLTNGRPVVLAVSFGGAPGTNAAPSTAALFAQAGSADSSKIYACSSFVFRFDDRIGCSGQWVNGGAIALASSLKHNLGLATCKTKVNSKGQQTAAKADCVVP